MRHKRVAVVCFEQENQNDKSLWRKTNLCRALTRAVPSLGTRNHKVPTRSINDEDQGAIEHLRETILGF